MALKEGDWPVRKRGYHRALKRGTDWAVKLSKMPPLQRLLTWVYHNPMNDLFREGLPSLFSSIPKSDVAIWGAAVIYPSETTAEDREDA